MKTVSAKLVSVHPISLSKSASIISNFASYENNGTSEVVSIYLNRASEAFSSLVQLHKDLKHPHSSHKKQRKKSNSDRENKRVEGMAKKEDGSVRVSGIQDMGTCKKRKQSVNTSELRNGGEDGGNEEVPNMVNGIVDRTKKKNKKKNENVQKSSMMEDSADEECRGGETGRGLGVEKGSRNTEEKKIKKRKENEIKNMEKEGEMEVELGKKDKKKKREEMRRDGKLDVGMERESKKKKRESVDLDDDLKENVVELTRKKRKKSKVADD